MANGWISSQPTALSTCKLVDMQANMLLFRRIRPTSLLLPDIEGNTGIGFAHVTNWVLDTHGNVFDNESVTNGHGFESGI